MCSQKSRQFFNVHNAAFIRYSAVYILVVLRHLWSVSVNSTVISACIQMICYPGFLYNQWRSQRGAGGHSPQSRKKIRMVGNGGPITGCLIHRVTKYSTWVSGCMCNIYFLSPILSLILSQTIVVTQIRFHVCRWLQHKS